MESCSKCGEQLESSWKFCPHCASTRPHEVIPEEHEPAPTKRAFGGLFFGIVMAPVLIIVGTMLCLTGLGAFVGVPMIIAGFASPLIGPMLGLGTHTGKCPWCGAAISSVPLMDTFACHECNGKISVRNHHEMVRAT